MERRNVNNQFSVLRFSGSPFTVKGTPIERVPFSLGNRVIGKKVRNRASGERAIEKRMCGDFDGTLITIVSKRPEADPLLSFVMTISVGIERFLYA
jgi:hypothetical protein